MIEYMWISIKIEYIWIKINKLSEINVNIKIESRNKSKERETWVKKNWGFDNGIWTNLQ